MSLLYPDLGCMCRVPGCGQYDLLASQCRLCGAITCTEHLKPERHECAGLVPREVVCGRCEAVIRVDVDAAAPRKEVTRADLTALLEAHRAGSCNPAAAVRTKCGVADCADDQHLILACGECGTRHCVAHRLPEDHDCPSLVKPPPPAPPLQTSSLPADEADRVPFYRWGFANTMEALDCSHVPEHLRFGLRVFFSPALRRRPRYLCASRAWPVGKVLDAACSAASLTNPNNTTSPQRYRMFLLWGACPVLPMSATIDKLLADFGTLLRMGSGVMVHPDDALPAPIVRAVPRWLFSVQLARLGSTGLQTSVRQRSFLDRLDDGPSLATRALRLWADVPGGWLCIALYCALLATVGWFDFH